MDSSDKNLQPSMGEQDSASPLKFRPPVPQLNITEAVDLAQQRGCAPTLPSDSERWYRRPGWKSRRVKHFAAPLDPGFFVSAVGRRLHSQHLLLTPAVAGGAPGWHWNADAAVRQPVIAHRQRICTLFPAAEIFSQAHLRNVQRDEAEAARHPRPALRQPAADRAPPYRSPPLHTTTPQSSEAFGSDAGSRGAATSPVHKEAVGAERGAKVHEAVAALLRLPFATHHGSWRERVRAPSVTGEGSLGNAGGDVAGGGGVRGR